jgi:hypothetical protein
MGARMQEHYECWAKVWLNIDGLGQLQAIILGGPTAFGDYYVQVIQEKHPLSFWVLMAQPFHLEPRIIPELRVVVPANDVGG